MINEFKNQVITMNLILHDGFSSSCRGMAK